MSEDDLTLYHAPRTRASSTLMLLEELDAPCKLHVLNLKIDEQRRPEYLAVNPLGKVPAIMHKGALVTEQGAIFIYLADAFPQRQLAPAIGEALRGPYLRWMVFYGSSFEPAILDRATKREAPPARISPYGDFDTVMAVIEKQLSEGPYLFGARFTAADVLWGTALNWTVQFGVLQPSTPIAAYIERIKARDSFKRVAETDAQLIKIHEAAAAASS